MIDQELIEVPPDVLTYPVESNRFASGEHWPKRGKIVVVPRYKDVYRVAKVDSRQSSYASIWLVPVHEQPQEGKDGSARSHYGERSGYFSTDVSYLARHGARIVSTDSPQGARFVADSIARQNEADRLAAEAAAKYAASLWGGVADQLNTVRTNLSWRVKELSGDANLVEKYASDLRAQLPNLPEMYVEELLKDITTVARLAEALRAHGDKLAVSTNHLDTLVETLRATKEVDSQS